MNIKNIFKGLLISISSLVVGFIAMAFPFHFFENLTSNQMTILFATEIIVYTAVGLIFLVVREADEEKKKLAKQRQEKQRAEIRSRKSDWFDLAA